MPATRIPNAPRQLAKTRTRCIRCTATTRNGQQCRLQTCKWAPFCHHHTPLEVRPSTLGPNAGYGVFLKNKVDGQRFRIGSTVANYSVGTQKQTKAQLNARFGANRVSRGVCDGNLNNPNTPCYDDPPPGYVVASYFNECRVGQPCTNNLRWGRHARNSTHIQLNRPVAQLRNRELFLPYGGDYWNE